MKNRRFWAIYLSAVCLILTGVYLFASPSMRIPFVLSEEQMKMVVGASNCDEFQNRMWCQPMTGCDASTSCVNVSGSINGKNYKSQRYVPAGGVTWYRCMDRGNPNDKCCIKGPRLVVCYEKYYSVENCVSGTEVYTNPISQPTNCTRQDP